MNDSIQKFIDQGMERPIFLKNKKVRTSFSTGVDLVLDANHLSGAIEMLVQMDRILNQTNLHTFYREWVHDVKINRSKAIAIDP